MKHLYNKIKPVGNRFIVLIDNNSKSVHKIKNDKGEEVELYIAHQYSWDGKESNITQGLLLTDYKNLKAGTNVLIHHNAINDTNELDIDDIPPYSRVHSVEDEFIYFGVEDEKYICIDGYMLAERIYEEEDTTPAGLILTEKKKVDCMLKIIGKPESITDYEVGDIAVVYKYSDYEMTHTVLGKQSRIIRLKLSDCIGKKIKDEA